jgi:hypothetical protein
MAGKSDYWENNLLKLLFNATALANIADNAAAAPLTNLYVSLHTADPTDSGSQTASEVSVVEDATYARVAVARTAGGWTVTGNSVSPASAISFPVTSAVGTGCTITHFGVGTDASGAGNLLYAGTLTPNVILPATTAGLIPQVTTASTITED